MNRNLILRRGEHPLTGADGTPGGPKRKLKKLPRRFYFRPTLTVARELLGTYLVRRIGRSVLVGRIVEVEAYMGSLDPASHAYRGKTRRNEIMFEEGGHLYVYFTYGMHFCANVVTEREGIGHAVLLRAIEPLEGIRFMERNRHLPSGAQPHLLCSGPARLCQAFAINRTDNGIDLCGDRVWLAHDAHRPPDLTIEVTTRVGISNGKEHKWRFLVKGNPFVSRGRPAVL